MRWSCSFCPLKFNNILIFIQSYLFFTVRTLIYKHVQPTFHSYVPPTDLSHSTGTHTPAVPACTLVLNITWFHWACGWCPGPMARLSCDGSFCAFGRAGSGLDTHTADSPLRFGHTTAGDESVLTTALSRIFSTMEPDWSASWLVGLNETVRKLHLPLWFNYYCLSMQHETKQNIP